MATKDLTGGVCTWVTPKYLFVKEKETGLTSIPMQL
jgi:hypothetical protein